MMQPDYYEVLQALPALKADSKHPPGPKLVLYDIVYTISRRCKNHIMWKCRVEGCKGTAKSTLEYTAPVIYTQHSAHPPNRAKADPVMTRHSMRETDVNTDIRPSRIFKEHLSIASDTVKALMPEEETVRRNMHRYINIII